MSTAVSIGLRSDTPSSPPRVLRVVGLNKLGPRLLRVRLGGDLTDFPKGCAGAHVKLFLKRPEQNTLTMPRLEENGPVWPPLALRPVTRTYTISAFDPIAQELSVDFVLHGDHGPATRWALHAVVGEELGILGPGGPNPMLAAAERYLLAGDLTALPAIAALVAMMPAATLGDVLIEAVSFEDKIPLRHPGNMRVRWFFRAPHAPSVLADEVRALALAPQQAFAFLAGESSSVIAMRDHLLHERGFSKKQLYATPYWRERQTEEEYHAERHRIVDELEEHAS